MNDWFVYLFSKEIAGIQDIEFALFLIRMIINQIKCEVGHFKCIESEIYLTLHHKGCKMRKG